MPNIVDILIRSTNATKPVQDEVEAEFGESGKRAADNFTRDANGRLHDNLGKFVAEGEELGGGAGKGAGSKFGATLSPLMMSVFAGIATEGPLALVAGAGVAVAGMTALVVKGNDEIAAQYHQLGSDVSTTLQEAVQPFSEDIGKSMTILDQGLSTAGPELKQVFAAAAPYSEDIAKSLVSIVTGSLPGFAAGMREIAPIMSELDTVTGDIGKGIGGFAQELGAGSGGAAVGLKAIGSSLAQILPDLGQVVATLSNGLGPALNDILGVATPLVNVLADIISVFPPSAIEGAAVATAALFAAFKVGTILGIVQEGTTFLAFLGATTAAEAEATVATEGLAASSRGLGAAMAIATGPVGILTTATVGLYMAIKNTGGTSGAMQSVIDKAKEYVAQQKQLAADTKASTDAMSHQAGISDDLSIALNTAASAATASAQQSATAALASVGLTNGTSGLTTGLYSALTAYSGATAAASGYNSILQALNGTTASLDDAQNSMAQQLLTLKTSFKANKDSMDLNTQAGINNRQALSSAAKTAVQLATAQYQATGNMAQANKTLQQQETAILNNIGVTGTLRDKVKAYLDQIMQIPKGVTTNINANTSPATKALRSLIETIDTSYGTVQVHVSSSGLGMSTSRGAATPGYAHGGVVGAAVGGPRIGRIRVGENGPEDVDLPAGAFVHSNADTMSHQGLGGVQKVAVELYWAGGSSDDWLFKAIRGGIRARAGADPNSVQKVLGGNF